MSSLAHSILIIGVTFVRFPLKMDIININIDFNASTTIRTVFHSSTNALKHTITHPAANLLSSDYPGGSSTSVATDI